MSYIGAKELKASDIRRFDVTGSTSATHTLTWSAPTEQSLIVTINGVKQQEDAYSVSGTTLTLTSALVSTDKLEVIGINDIGTTITPAQNSVTADTIADGVITNAKIDASAAIATSKISGLAASATTDTTDASNIASGTLATARLGSGTADSSVFLRGDQSWASAGGDMTPSFGATATTNQSVSSSTQTEMIFDSEDWDTDSAYDPSTGRFTVPSGEGGKYFFTATLGVATSSGSTADSTFARMAFRKNGNELGGGNSSNPFTNQDLYLTHTLVTTLSAGDYISVYLYQTLRSPAVTGAGSMSFAGWKLIL